MINTLLGWALSLGKLIARILRAVFSWVTSDWRHAAIAMLGGICAVYLFWVEPAWQQRIADRTEERDTARQERDDARTLELREKFYEEAFFAHERARNEARRRRRLNAARRGKR